MAPGNRKISLTIEAKNQASSAFRAVQADIRATQGAASGMERSFVALGNTTLQNIRQNEAFKQSLGVTSGELRNADLISKRLTRSQEQFEKQIINGTRAIDGQNTELRRGFRAHLQWARGLSNVHGQLVAVSVAQRTLNNALNATAISQARAAINLERLQVALQTISGSTERATAQYERLIDVARLPGINLENSLRASTQLQAIGKSGVEATEIIRQFGNALALSSQSPRELRQTIRGLSQLSTVGSVLQEDLEIITSRISILNRGLKELGGPRAEGIRKFYDALGVPPDQQGPRLVEDMLRILSELPRAGNTAANAIENLFDTTERAQATIGRNFLPIIRESTSELEKLAARIEKNPELARTIALFETFAGTLGTVAVAIAGVGVALTFLGPALIATFTNPVGLAALAVGALAAAVLTWKVANESAQQPLQDLNPLIERNTELIERNRRAKEENNRSELQATGQSLQDAITQIQGRIEVIRQAGAEAHGVLARLDDRLQNLQGARGRQTSQLAARVDEEFDDAFIAVRGFSEELTKAEAELQRLTETAEATDAITDGFKEADQAAENLRETINKLGKEISEGALTDSLRASLSGQNVNPKILLGDLVDVQSALNRVSETYDEIASNAGDSEAAQTQLAEIQGVLTGATERYLDALSQSLALTLADTDAKESDFEEVQRLAQGYIDYYQGRGDAFQAYVDRAEGLAEQATAAIGQLDLAERAEDAQKEAERALAAFERQQIAAVKAVIAEEEAAYKQRIAFTRRQQTETTQALRTSDRIQRDLLTERTDAEEESAENAIDAVNERAEASEAAAGRVTGRWLDAIDERERAEERADRDAARREQQAERRRERQAEREAQKAARLQRQFRDELISGLGESIDLPFLESGIRAALGDPTAFAREWGEGFFGGLQNIFDGEELDPTGFRASIQGLTVGELEREPLEQALTINLDQQARLIEAHGENVARSTEVFEALVATEANIRDELEQIGERQIPLSEQVNSLLGGGDDRIELSDRVRKGLVASGIPDAERFSIIDRLPEASLSELRGIAGTVEQATGLDVARQATQRRDFQQELSPTFNILGLDESVESQIAPAPIRERIIEGARELGLSSAEISQLEVDLSDKSLDVLESINSGIQTQVKNNERAEAENERAEARNLREAKRQTVSLSSVLALSRESQEELSQLLREDEDSPLQDILNNRQGLLRLFSAEKIDAFLVGAQDLIEDQRELARRQRREQDPDFAFIDDLRTLLEVAEVPEEERTTLLDRFEEALGREFIGQEGRNELVEALVDVFDRFNINTDVRDTFTSRFADLLPVWDDIRLSSEESAAYLRELRDFLLSQGVPEARIEPLIAQFEKAFADNVVNFQEGQNLFGQLNTLLSEFNIPEISLDEFGTGLADGLEATFDNLTLIAELDEDAKAGLDEDAKAGLDEDAEAGLDPEAEAKLEDGAEVDVNTEGKTVPVGELPEGTKVPIDALPPGTRVPIEDLPEDVKILFAGVPDGTLIPIEDLPEGTLIPIEALSPDIEIPFGGIAEGTVVPFGGVPETESVAFEGVPEGTLIAVEDTADREIAVEDTSDRTIQVEFVVPTTEAEPAAGAGQVQVERIPPTDPSGGPRPTTGGIDAQEAAFLFDTDLILRATEKAAGGVIEGVQNLLNNLQSAFSLDNLTVPAQENLGRDLRNTFDYSGEINPTTTAFFLRWRRCLASKGKLKGHLRQMGHAGGIANQYSATANSKSWHGLGRRMRHCL